MDLASAPKHLQKMTLFLHVTTLLLCTENVLSNPDPHVKTKPDSIHVFHVHLAHLDLTSPALTGVRRPSPIPFASNFTMLRHHAQTCNCCSITPSTVGHLLRSSHTINSKHFGTFVKNSALQMVFFLILLAPSSLLLSDQVC